MTEQNHRYTFQGFDGPYWKHKAEQARQDAFRAHEAEHRSAKAEAAARIVSEAQDGVGKVVVEKTDAGQQEFDSRGPWV